MMAATRFAPSPTGLLHLGHAYSALLAHDRARALGGAFLLRIDDIDEGRSRPEYLDAITDDLAWLGIVPDGAPTIQSTRREAYADALAQLRDMNLLYPCFCTRAAIQAEVAAMGAAPHGPSGILYPGTCRSLDKAAAEGRVAAGEAHSWRLDIHAACALAGPLSWMDEVRGLQPSQPAAHGDIILARRDAPVAYHLASTVDDAFMNISHVVRGVDLLRATDIHRLLQALLGLPTPLYHHHRLIGDADGRRLAKRDDAASLAMLRANGTDPAMLVDQLRAGIVPLGYCWLEE